MAQTKKIPQRKCAACGEHRDKSELFRIVRIPEGEILVDDTGRKNGRGAYLCRSEACIARAAKTKALQRSLKVEIPEEIFDGLRSDI